jgi:hypothetical protein
VPSIKSPFGFHFSTGALRPSHAGSVHRSARACPKICFPAQFLVSPGRSVRCWVFTSATGHQARVRSFTRISALVSFSCCESWSLARFDCRHRLLAVRAEAFTEWPGACVACLVQPGSELCYSFSFAYPTRSAAQFLSALSILVAYVRLSLVLELSDQKS